MENEKRNDAFSSERSSRRLGLIPFLLLAMLSVVAFAACSDDDDEGGSVAALRGSYLAIGEGVKEYVDGEYVGDVYDFQSMYFYRLSPDGTVESLGRRNPYDAATWSFNGNAIVVSYLDSDGNVADTDRFVIENVYDFGRFVLRLNLDEEGTHYYRIACTIDSDAYDDAEDPDWWTEEWH